MSETKRNVLLIATVILVWGVIMFILKRLEPISLCVALAAVAIGLIIRSRKRGTRDDKPGNDAYGAEHALAANARARMDAIEALAHTARVALKVAIWDFGTDPSHQPNASVKVALSSGLAPLSRNETEFLLGLLSDFDELGWTKSATSVINSKTKTVCIYLRPKNPPPSDHSDLSIGNEIV